jgi:hypothetical protein
MAGLIQMLPDVLIFLGTLAVLLLAVVTATLSWDDRGSASPGPLPPLTFRKDLPYPGALSDSGSRFGPRLPGVVPDGRYFSLWGLGLSVRATYVSRLTGALQRIRR